jgi:hypothetical protein
VRRPVFLIILVLVLAGGYLGYQSMPNLRGLEQLWLQARYRVTGCQELGPRLDYCGGGDWRLMMAVPALQSVTLTGADSLLHFTYFHMDPQRPAEENLRHIFQSSQDKGRDPTPLPAAMVTDLFGPETAFVETVEPGRTEITAFGTGFLLSVALVSMPLTGDNPAPVSPETMTEVLRGISLR